MSGTSAEKRCPCPWCGVRLETFRPELVADAYACGHDRCFQCRQHHAGTCWVCNPPPLWTETDALTWLVRHYVSARDVEAARRDFKATVSRIASVWGGASGPHRPSYRTRSGKVYIEPPSRKSGDTTEYVFSVERIVREAMDGAKARQGVLL